MSQQPPDEQHDAHPVRRSLNQSNAELLIDKLINQARKAGQFDNLTGTGRPLEHDDESLVPDDLRAAFRMLKNAGFAPPWVEARRDIDAERARIAGWLNDANQRWPRLNAAGRERLRREYDAMLAALQRQIISYNLTSPPSAGQLEGLRIEEEVRKLGG